MSYKNAKDVLPVRLLRELQRYADGELLYIPSAAPKTAWGEKNGARGQYDERNAAIRSLHSRGFSADRLAAEFCLSADSIRKILAKPDAAPDA